MSTEFLRIASLDCDIPVPNVYAERGTYSDIFEALLRKAAKTELRGITNGLDLKVTRYDAVRGHLPRDDQLNEIDGIIITGSASSAYDDVPWIKSLIIFCQNLYHNHPRIKLFGSCFGHQLLSHAIFSPITDPPHSVVSEDPAGWEIGIHATTLTPSFLSFCGPVTSNAESPTKLRLQFIHADHVVLSPALLEREGFASVGRSEHCALQGVWKPGRVLTYQGHAEFDHSINGETVKVFGKGVWSEAFIDQVLTNVNRGDDDATWAAGVMLRFFIESSGNHAANLAETESGGSSEHEF